ncbi:MAG: hypothetical protein F9K45_00605 [Melioribacteraceae bacterium]|nr:MAG: hypothetical protein F9K45_00605 [Melioribacteraceae bacterium]
MNFRKNILTKKILSLFFAGCAVFQLTLPAITFENLPGVKSQNVIASSNDYSISLNYIETSSKKFDKNNFSKTTEYKYFYTNEFIFSVDNSGINSLFSKYIKYISPDPNSCDHFTKTFFLRSPPAIFS